MVYKLKYLLNFIDRFLPSGDSGMNFGTPALRKKPVMPRGPIKSRWLNLIVHHTRKDKMFKAFGKDPTI